MKEQMKSRLPLLAPALHLVRICGRDHGLPKSLSLVTHIQADHALRVCLLNKDVRAEQQEFVMQSKVGVKLAKCLAVVRRALCAQRHSKILS